MEPVKAPAPLVIISSSPYIHCGSTISAAMAAMFYYHFCRLWPPLFTFSAGPALQRYPYLLPLGCHL